MIYILQSRTGGAYGTYTSKKHLSEGVDYWMKIFPNKTFAYQEWKENYAAEPFGWDWAYIAPKSRKNRLATGGGFVPDKKYWGKNLIGIQWLELK